MVHVLILGGTTEARVVARQLVERGLRVTLSLAGRTASPLPQAGAVRSGGFGGVDGLRAWLERNHVDILVDATHPFAARISRNAELAAHGSGVALVALERRPWLAVEGDRWVPARDVSDAARLIGAEPRRLFLAIGRQELEPFRTLPQHDFLVRSVDPVDPGILPGARFILDRGPFDETAERDLLQRHRIELVVAKNSGGDATYAKLAAARALKIPVIMVERPRAPRNDAVASVEEALARVVHLAGLLPEKRGE